MMRTLFALGLLLLAALANASIGVYQLDTPEQEERFKRLSAELRCLVCQNQNLADSNAELAQDLRRQVHTMILQGQDDEAIITFMTERYGDFVLYRPPFNYATLLLWGGPILLFLIGSVVLTRVVRRRGAEGATQVLDRNEQKRLAALLREQGKDRS